MALVYFCLLQMFGLQRRGEARDFKNMTNNSNSNYNNVIINYYVMMVLMILPVPSILLFTL